MTILFIILMLYWVNEKEGVKVTVGERIKKLRIENNLTQKQLSDLCRKISDRKISEGTIRKYELGILKNPKRETIQIIASALGVSEYELQGISREDILKSLSETSSFYSYLHSLGYEVHESPHNDKWIIYIKETDTNIYITSEEMNALEYTTKENIDLRIGKYMNDKQHLQ